MTLKPLQTGGSAPVGDLGVVLVDAGTRVAGSGSDYTPFFQFLGKQATHYAHTTWMSLLAAE